MLPGVFVATKKDGTIYYRSNITYKNKHISLGSFSTEMEAHQAYTNARTLLSSNQTLENSFYLTRYLSFDKLVSLINFRDNNIYIANPIYLRKNYFSYYMAFNKELKFDIDDLFYYSSHKIMQRRGHLFVNDYGMQVTILSRYGIKPHAVCGRDYIFVNGDDSDFRYSNIQVINPYFGVTQFEKNGIVKYRTKIHINGNFTIGTYSSAEKAAIAYNKAVDLAKAFGVNRNYSENYILDLSAKEYAETYTKIKISKKYESYLKGLPN
ncbi:MAG: hypothetical protein UIC64_01485 [Agathobacter sp.]|nr:hypothetical protein [Agathobacter sp.]